MCIWHAFRDATGNARPFWDIAIDDPINLTLIGVREIKQKVV